MATKYKYHHRSVELNPNWFKLKIVSRKTDEKGKPLETDYAYTSGFTAAQVKDEVQKSLGLAHFVTVKPIEYDDIIRELNRAVTPRQGH